MKGREGLVSGIPPIISLLTHSQAFPKRLSSFLGTCPPPAVFWCFLKPKTAASSWFPFTRSRGDVEIVITFLHQLGFCSCVARMVQVRLGLDQFSYRSVTLGQIRFRLSLGLVRPGSFQFGQARLGNQFSLGRLCSVQLNSVTRFRCIALSGVSKLSQLVIQSNMLH